MFLLSTFFSRAFAMWDKLSSGCFPDHYNRNLFLSRVNRQLRTYPLNLQFLRCRIVLFLLFDNYEVGHMTYHSQNDSFPRCLLCTLSRSKGKRLNVVVNHKFWRFSFSEAISKYDFNTFNGSFWCIFVIPITVSFGISLVILAFIWHMFYCFVLGSCFPISFEAMDFIMI